jgi:hypothetical protein
MISSTMELSYLQSYNDSLHQRAQKEGVHCRYALLELMGAKLVEEVGARLGDPKVNIRLGKIN